MSGCKVFVGSLPSDITEDLLRLEFSKFGDVDEIFIKQGCEPGRQWAMVKYATYEQAQLAKESCDRILVFPGSDKPCDVMLAKNQGKGGGPAHTGGAYQPSSNGYGTDQSVALATGSSARKIFVGSLPDFVAEETIRAEYMRYGAIEDIFIKPNCESGRQWAFVTFSYPEQAQQAVEATNGVLQFPGSFKPCEVTLARHQGMFGQDPLGGAAAGAPPTNSMYSHGAPVASTPEAPRKIFVGSLPDNITDMALRAEFSKYGTITDVFVKTGCEANRQWAFVTFDTHEAAQHAKESCDRILVFPGADRPCEVTIAKHQGMFGRESDDPAELARNSRPYGNPYTSPAVDGPKKIFVGSLPDGINEVALKAEFSKYGQVTEIFLKHGQESGRHWAFVSFTTAEQAQYAKDSTDRVLMFPGQERTCEVTLARNQGKFGQAPIGSLGGGRAGAGGAPVSAMPPIADGPQPPPPSTPPPPHLTPWRMYRTASGLPYYHNATTGVTQWECPPDFQVPGHGNPQYPAPMPSQSGAAYGQQRYSPY